MPPHDNIPIFILRPAINAGHSSHSRPLSASISSTFQRHLCFHFTDTTHRRPYRYDHTNTKTWGPTDSLYTIHFIEFQRLLWLSRDNRMLDTSDKFSRQIHIFKPRCNTSTHILAVRSTNYLVSQFTINLWLEVKLAAINDFIKPMLSNLSSFLASFRRCHRLDSEFLNNVTLTSL